MKNFLLQRCRLQILIGFCLLAALTPLSAQNLDSPLGDWGTPFSATPAQKVEKPFSVQITPEEKEGQRGFSLSVQIAPEHYLYKDEFRVTAADGSLLEPTEPLKSVRIKDIFAEEDKDVFKESFKAQYTFSTPAQSASVKIEYMGCSREMCFMPEEVEQKFSWTGESPSVQESEHASNPVVSAAIPLWQERVASFKTIATDSGSMDKESFLKFLDRADGKNEQGGIEGFLAKWGMVITIPLILLFGIGLNLTPCVLPMIPINLAIIGAGVKAGSKAQGLFLGGLYGLGMALAYGTLGLAVVLAGATFGALNASPWFNLGTAAVFVILALAMFDVFTIDFSRFQGPTQVGSKTGLLRYILIFGLGAFSALLAGACVAPALISVLLISANIYNSGNYLGLLLPFLLGAGMALPWPIAGAGIAALPKPGMWMNRVKQAFGVLILLFAAYYAFEGYKLWKSAAELTRIDTHSAETTEAAAVAVDEQLAQAMQESLTTGKPIFVDFWATWCKSCMYMEKTTFSDADVRKRLESEFIVLKLQTEQPRKSPAKEILDHYGVIGLPTCLILKPTTAAP
ncbi:MAG TPA: thioredoxin family protein [Verrucomicrobiota bacterium]|jgi:thiol:disulfide interchange protein|nr:thioredoxin family protein [Verrucomicrobiota bacterium]